ncbi:hypothetical protein GCM10025865_32910 [Paraoerskovia sediminicola]|uniref:Chorismate mutase domain-containing protein n=1 Tax=Paraoerskovia sediminicola TaxID=1138587 RepID=A0ABN6XGK6_9CELL|nr:hypothetical protein GCM10025865_32910 [Paraoerskovia sediminicola]
MTDVPPSDTSRPSEVPDEILRLRGSIDNVDAALMHLLAERFKFTRRVGELKAEAGLPAADLGREAAQIARLGAIAEGRAWTRRSRSSSASSSSARSSGSTARSRRRAPAGRPPQASTSPTSTPSPGTFSARPGTTPPAARHHPCAEPVVPFDVGARIEHNDRFSGWNYRFGSRSTSSAAGTTGSAVNPPVRRREPPGRRPTRDASPADTPTEPRSPHRGRSGGRP